MLINANAASVNSITSTTPTTGAAAASSTLDYNSFLTMLVTELKNQDPTKPMDATQMVSQLATISGVGQAVQTNATLSSLLVTNSMDQAEQLIGKTITSSDGLTSGVVQSVTVNATGGTAMLVDGTTVSLGDGVTISAS